MTCYLVGGCVRDTLLGLAVRDRDWVVVGATREQMLAQGFLQVGKDFPVFLHPTTKEEYALARSERKVSPGYKGFTVHTSPEVTLEEDLLRRDLTINAMAMTDSGEIIDPFCGQRDLHLGILRHVSPAFKEDPVRILRLARFAARYANLGFRIAPETMLLMEEMVSSGEINALVPARVWQELLKALSTTKPSFFFQVLRRCGALEVLFPELSRLFGVPQPVASHPEIDVGVHTMKVVDCAAHLSADSVVSFAALLHDLGKGLTVPEMWPRHHEHEDQGLALVNAVCQRYGVPNAHREMALLVAQYHGHCHRALELRAASVVKLLNSLDVWRRPQRLTQFLLACEADSRGRTYFESRTYVQAQIFTRAHGACLKIDVSDLAAQNLPGILFKRKLHQRRVAAVKQVLQE